MLPFGSLDEELFKKCLCAQVLEELEIDLDNLEVDDIDTSDVNLDDDFLED